MPLFITFLWLHYDGARQDLHINPLSITSIMTPSYISSVVFLFFHPDTIISPVFTDSLPISHKPYT